MKTHNHPHIETVRNGSLKPIPRNARTQSKKQISQIAASIKQFGWLGTVIVDDGMRLSRLHFRFRRQMYCYSLARDRRRLLPTDLSNC